MTEMTPEALLAAGYTAFHDKFAADRFQSYYRTSFQKWISDAVGKCYAITINHGVFPTHAFFDIRVQFHRGETCFNVDLIYLHETIEQIEALYAEIWTKMGADRAG